MCINICVCSVFVTHFYKNSIKLRPRLIKVFGKGRGKTTFSKGVSPQYPSLSAIFAITFAKNFAVWYYTRLLSAFSGRHTAK